jgi:SulP family sulfate permease
LPPGSSLKRASGPPSSPGALTSALGGSAVQIGGPASASIVIVYGIVNLYGLASLLISPPARVCCYFAGF